MNPLDTTDLTRLKQQAQLAKTGTGYVTVAAETLIDLVNFLNASHDALAAAREDLTDTQDALAQAETDIDGMQTDLREAETEIVVLEDEVKNLRAIVEEDEASPFES